VDEFVQLVRPVVGIEAKRPKLFFDLCDRDFSLWVRLIEFVDEFDDGFQEIVPAVFTFETKQREGTSRTNLARECVGVLLT